MLQRTRNLDVANDGVQTNTLWRDTSDDITVEIGIADAGAIYQMLSDLSANKGAYVMREAYSNAYDATMRAGDLTKPIEITLPKTAATPSLASKIYGTSDVASIVTIEDHGCGMSTDIISNYFLQYGGSDKRDEIDAIGSKGLGSKAPLAVTESFTVESTKDGITTLALVERKRNTAGAARIMVQHTGKPSGTKISIPVADKNVLAEMQEFLDTLAVTACDIPLIINGQLITASLPTQVGHVGAGYVYLGKVNIQTDDNPCIVRVWEPVTCESTIWRDGGNLRYITGTFPMLETVNESDPIDIILGGVRYALQRERYSSHNPIIIGIDAGWLDFTPSRDEIKQNDARTQLIEAIIKKHATFDYTPVLKAHLEQATDIEKLDFFSKCEPPAKPSQRTGFSGYHDATSSYTYLYEDTNDAITLFSSALNRHNFSSYGLAQYKTSHPYATLDRAFLDRIGIGFENLEADIDDTVRVFQESERGRGDTFTLETICHNSRKNINKSEIDRLSFSATFTDPRLPTSWRDVAGMAQFLDRKNTIIAVSGVDDDKKLRYVLKRLNVMRSYIKLRVTPFIRPRYLIYNDASTLPELVRTLVDSNRVAKTSYEELREHVKAIAAKKRAETKAKKAEDAVAESVVDTSDWDNAQFVQADTLEIPTGTTEELLSFSFEGRNALPNATRNDFRIETRFITGLADDNHSLAQCVIISDSENDIELRVWAAVIALLWKHEPQMFTTEPKYVLSFPKGSRASDVLLAEKFGATFAIDNRPKFKNHVAHTLVNDYPDIISVSGMTINLTTHSLFGDNETLKQAWYIMSQPYDHTDDFGRNFALSVDTVMLAATCYDLIKDVDQTFEDDPRPIVADIFALRGKTSQHSYETVMWRSTSDSPSGWNGGQISPWVSHITLKDEPAGADELKQAVHLLADTIQPLQVVLRGYGRGANDPDSTETKQSAALIGPALVYNITNRD